MSMYNVKTTAKVKKTLNTASQLTATQSKSDRIKVVVFFCICCLAPRHFFVNKTEMRVCQVYMKYCSENRRAKGLMGRVHPSQHLRRASPVCLNTSFIYNYLKRLGTRQLYMHTQGVSQKKKFCTLNVNWESFFDRSKSLCRNK